MMELPKRKHTRLPGYDYSTPGMYFITVCARQREMLLGRIVGGGDFDAPKMVLSENGKILEKYLRKMNEEQGSVQIHKYVIMPNHFHLLVCISEQENGASKIAAPYNNELSKFVSLLKRYCNRECGENIWQKSFHDHVIRGEKDYQKIWQYIDTNVIRWQKDCFYRE